MYGVWSVGSWRQKEDGIVELERWKDFVYIQSGRANEF